MEYIFLQDVKLTVTTHWNIPLNITRLIDLRTNIKILIRNRKILVSLKNISSSILVLIFGSNLN